MVVDYAQNTNSLISLVGNVSANGIPFLVRNITSSVFQHCANAICLGEIMAKYHLLGLFGPNKKRKGNVSLSLLIWKVTSYSPLLGINIPLAALIFTLLGNNSVLYLGCRLL